MANTDVRCCAPLVRGACADHSCVLSSRIILCATTGYPPTAAAIATDLHAQVTAYLLAQLDSLDLDSMLLTKKLVKAGTLV